MRFEIETLTAEAVECTQDCESGYCSGWNVVLKFGDAIVKQWLHADVWTDYDYYPSQAAGVDIFVANKLRELFNK